MKCKKEGSDIELEFRVYAQDEKCTEYELPLTASSPLQDPHTLECFIPVTEGDRLKLVGFTSGTFLNGRIDLLADGSYVYTRVIEPSKNGTSKTHSRKRTDITTVTHAPKQFPKNSTVYNYLAPKLVDGNLMVNTLAGNVEDRHLAGDGPHLGVGTLAVIFSVNHDAAECYGEGDGQTGQYEDYAVGNWVFRNQDVRNTGIKPTKYLSVKPTKEDGAIAKKNNFRRSYGALRFGSKPWVRLLFHYRTKAAIIDAGGVECQRRLRPFGAAMNDQGTASKDVKDKGHATENIVMSRVATDTARPMSAGSPDSTPDSSYEGNSGLSSDTTKTTQLKLNKDQLNVESTLKPTLLVVNSVQTSASYRSQPKSGKAEQGKFSEQVFKTLESASVNDHSLACPQTLAHGIHREQDKTARLEDPHKAVSTLEPNLQESLKRKLQHEITNTPTDTAPSILQSVEQPCSDAQIKENAEHGNLRNSTPSKRLRRSEMTERKRTLHRVLEEKAHAKIAAGKALEKQRSLREAEQRKQVEEEKKYQEEETQIAELEKMVAEEDAEIERLAREEAREASETERIKQELIEMKE